MALLYEPAGGAAATTHVDKSHVCTTAVVDQWEDSLNNQAFVRLPLLIGTGKTRVTEEETDATLFDLPDVNDGSLRGFLRLGHLGAVGCSVQLPVEP